jgi:hypothetical protein
VLPWKSDPGSGANRRHTTHLIVGAVQGNCRKELDRKGCGRIGSHFISLSDSL